MSLKNIHDIQRKNRDPAFKPLTRGGLSSLKEKRLKTATR